MKIIPVIHHLNEALTMRNAEICHDANVFGVFLISMTGENEDLPKLADTIKKLYPQLKVGINLLGESALDSIKKSLDFNLDLTWSDNPIVTSTETKDEAYIISEMALKNSHLFFNSVAFKYQRTDHNPALAALKSKELSFIPTTSGSATGVAAEISKLKLMKNALVDYPLAVASGIDLTNVLEMKQYVDYGLVATGISESFHELDYEKTMRIVGLAN